MEGLKGSQPELGGIKFLWGFWKEGLGFWLKGRGLGDPQFHFSLFVALPQKEDATIQHESSRAMVRSSCGKGSRKDPHPHVSSPNPTRHTHLDRYPKGSYPPPSPAWKLQGHSRWDQVFRRPKKASGLPWGRIPANVSGVCLGRIFRSVFRRIYV